MEEAYERKHLSYLLKPNNVAGAQKSAQWRLVAEGFWQPLLPNCRETWESGAGASAWPSKLAQRQQREAASGSG